MQDQSKGLKFDASKPRWSLLPAGTVAQVVDVLEFGAKRYGDNNWQKVENARTRYYDAAMRHLEAWKQGQAKDPESGAAHLAHAACCLLFLMHIDTQAEKAAADDAKTEEMIKRKLAAEMFEQSKEVTRSIAWHAAQGKEFK